MAKAWVLGDIDELTASGDPSPGLFLISRDNECLYCLSHGQVSILLPTVHPIHSNA